MSEERPNDKPLLELRGMRAGYERVPVVHGADLHVAPGEIVALLGPNGAGKTTTLMTISGLLPSLGGEVRVFGELQPAGGRRGLANRALKLVRRGLAYVPEDRALFFGLSGADHLRLATPRGDTGARQRALAPFPALAAIIERHAGLMSGGEQQMLTVARALAMRPKLLMIDELSLGLAPIIVQELLPLIRDVARERDMGVLLVEQHVSAALGIADRAYVMVRGTIVTSGPASELAADADRIAQSYLGGTHGR